MNAQEFESRYVREGDPWGYRTSEYEQRKYARTLDACGPGPFESALELGGSIGVFSAMLAPRCRSLSTVDFSPTAVRCATAELAPFPHAHAILGPIPAALPDGLFELVVASEVLYYLEAETLLGTFEALRPRLAQSGRLVAVHWIKTGPERPLSAHEVHAALRGLDWLTSVRSEVHDAYLLDVLERQ